MKNLIGKPVYQIEKIVSKGSLSLLIILSSIAHAQELPGILIMEKLTIQYEEGHGCMTQTKEATKEDASYTMNNCGSVKYELTKKGKRFTIYEKDGAKWIESFEYKIQHSSIDKAKGFERYTFLAADGSSIVYVPITEDGPLVILDLVGQEHIHYVYR